VCAGVCCPAVIYTCEPIAGNRQYFWEAFPAASHPTDRTTYMFTYLDAHPDRPSLEQVNELSSD
jgi:lycopene cyclase CruP